eukprot:scaffold57557_cov63-Phaeocystis_antarctica.AAC.2
MLFITKRKFTLANIDAWASRPALRYPYLYYAAQGTRCGESVLSDSLPFYTAGAEQTSAPTPMVRARQPSLS